MAQPGLKERTGEEGNEREDGNLEKKEGREGKGKGKGEEKEERGGREEKG